MNSVKRNGEQIRSLSYLNENCLGCGICAEICPTTAIKLNPILPIARGLLKMDYININEDNCALCGLCASACPFSALEFTINDINIKYMEEYPKWTHNSIIDDDACMYCGACEIACPRDAINVARTLPPRKDLVTGEISIEDEKCISCGICEEMCPAEAITTKRDQKQISDVKVDEKKCVYCLICKRICPADAIKAVCRICSYGEQDLDPKDAEITGNIILSEYSCINCGGCQEICPVDAAKITKPFEGEIIFQEDFECKGETCHACEDVCSCNAIKIEDNKSVVNPKVCVLCGACEKACPQNGIMVNREKMNLENIRSKSWQKILSGLLK